MSCSGFVYDAGGGIWKWNILNHTVGKTAKCNKCDLTSIRANKNAINAPLPVLIQVIWVNIWNHTVGKSQINATSSKPEGGSSITESTFQVQAARLFNSLPKEVRNLTKCGAEDFKAHLDAYLSTFYDEPPSPGHIPRGLTVAGLSSNSIIFQKIKDDTSLGMTRRNNCERDGMRRQPGHWWRMEKKKKSDQERITMKVLIVLALKPVWLVQVWVKSFVESSLTKSKLTYRVVSKIWLSLT